MSRAGRLLEKVEDDAPVTSTFDLVLAELKAEWDGREVQSALFQVTGSDRTIKVLYEIGFKRSTKTIAYQDNKQLIDYCNRVLADIGQSHGVAFSTKVTPLTLEVSTQLDKEAESRGEDPFSEFEQTFGGSVVLTFS